MRPLLIISLLLASCSATNFQAGGDFDIKTFSDKVERGSTSQTQVRLWLGAPAGVGDRVETDGTRFEEWTYYFARGSIPNLAGTQIKTLQIKYDTRGIVQGYSWSQPAK